MKHPPGSFVEPLTGIESAESLTWLVELVLGGVDRESGSVTMTVTARLLTG